VNTIGVVGLGTMGSRIAGRLLDTGYQVHATNRTRTRGEALIERGLHWQDTPRAVAAAADVVLSMVTDDDALSAVTGGPDGILAGLRSGQVYVDMSSVSPQSSVSIAERVHSLGAAMLDAPVSGSGPQVDHGDLAIMVGGDETAFRQVEELLAHLGHAVTRVGGNGQGVLLKMAINISLAVQMLAFSEGLLLAERGGIDPTLAAQVMSSSSIGSPMIKARVPLILDLPPDAWFDVRLMHKDIRLALRQASGLQLELPTTDAADRVLAVAERTGYAHRDIAALRQVLAHLNPVAAPHGDPTRDHVVSSTR
jgi:3-hydroxyisobutyrate dehydrogenase-like beta-hydroxyacid dehydrogenase